MKKIAFFLFCLFMGGNLSATDFIKDYRAERKGTHSLGFKLEGFRSPALVQYDYSNLYLNPEEIGVFSKESFGFKGTLNYFYHIHPKARLSLGFVGGRDSYRIQLVFPANFISVPDNTLYLYDLYYVQISFLGLNFSVNLDLPIGKRSYLHFMGSLSGVYLHNAKKVKEVSIVAKRPNDEDIQVFHANFKQNEDLLFAPSIGCGYAYKINENLRLQATLNVLYSEHKTIQTTNDYVFTNGEDTFSGSFEKRFMHAGFGLEMVYTLPNKPKN